MTEIIPSSGRVAIQTRVDEQATLLAQEEAKFDAEREELYQEIEPLLTWLGETEENEIVAQMESDDPALVLQGVRGLLDDEERKAMFAHMNDGGGGHGVGKGSVGKAVGAGKAAEKGMGKAVGKGVGGKGVGSGVGKGVGKRVAKAAPLGKQGRLASIKAGTAKKLYNARLQHHVNQAPRDLAMAQHHLATAEGHKTQAAEFQKLANYHHAEATTVGNVIGSLAHAVINPGVPDKQGSVGHSEMRREAQAMADHHVALEADNKHLASHHATQAKMHAQMARSMKANSPYTPHLRAAK